MECNNQIFVHLKNLWTNIGNAFIDLGAIILWEKVLDNNLIYPMYYMKLPTEFILMTLDRIKFASSLIFSRIINKVRLFYHNPEDFILKNYKSFIIVPDNIRFVSVSGMIMTKRFMMIYKPWLEKFSKKGYKIIFLGTGGSKYNENEVENVSKILKNINPYVLVARDPLAYKYYNGYFEHSITGLDNAYLLREKYLENVPKEYDVIVFDSTPIPKNIRLKTNKGQMIRVYHSFYASIKPGKVLEKNDIPILVSDNPFDYIALYNRAKHVYSDRIHACIAGITFGSLCKLYCKSDKRHLLIDMVSENISNMIKLNINKYEKIKSKEIEFLKETLIHK